MKNWTTKDSLDLYKIDKWGEGYFSVNSKGNLSVNPESKKSLSIDINEVIEEMKEQGVTFPVVIRFHDILRSRVKQINKTFRSVIEEAEYEGRYQGVYPIKVNQMREVVEEIVDAGKIYDYGLEAGSKPELLAVLSMNDSKKCLTILNGYKDDEYMRLALLGNKVGRKMIIVIEKFSEIEKIIRISKELNVQPLVGLRGKMSVAGCGRWAGSTGERAKFGLSVSEMIQAVEIFTKNDMIDSIKLFHFHIGSQIPEIRSFKEAVSEGGRIYAKLVQMGVPLEYFDVGGGLGVDYDGTRSNNESSTNYNFTEYVSDIVYSLKQICDLEGVTHPHIVTESGRAITAHHSCVVTNVIDKIEAANDFNTKKETGEHIFVSNMREIEAELYERHSLQESFNDAAKLKEDALNAFKLGILSLSERAKIETIFNKINLFIENETSKLEIIPEELQILTNDNSPKYLCNFSVFQSAADSWAIGQVLPVVPITRLNEEPTVNCSIADITCDSDGKIDRFIEINGQESTFPVHDLKKDEDYYLGIFLTGAYQDVMGDMHNLFGRLNEVHVFKDEEDPSGFYIEEIIKGQSCSKVLSTMQYNPKYMAYSVKKVIDREISRGKIPARMGVKLVDFYEDCLKGYTYLKN
ncbi:biosynthetic arginine decarboxylase [Halobacteriovorax sp. HLS]|uniref:biosynthetic arginine decarboxylase n=1 Tax=Halobacteriovorax sp. HLS TaxID=2234000 RepID=UPI000FDC90BC|nr:biosynthetic arginine decarboxylase [Halobacteriovorax sp. HLS]